MLLILLIVLILCLGGLPTWGYHPYGYYPSGFLGFVLLILLIWFMIGHP